MPAPGTQILLPQVAMLVRPRVARPSCAPTYAEHRARRYAGRAQRDRKFPAPISSGAPTSPSSSIRTIPTAVLSKEPPCWTSLTSCDRAAGLLVVDESFADVAPPGASLAGDIGRGNIVVLRSFGKFFGLAGLRLGFALAAPSLVDRLDAMLGPWAVAGPAMFIGEKALADRAWKEQTLVRLAEAADAAR